MALIQNDILGFFRLFEDNKSFLSNLFSTNEGFNSNQRVVGIFLLPPFHWFTLNNLETVKDVNLSFCNIQ